ncbi:hypothetical protein J7384_17920 [Endozoicomonas sp. G2_1]|uniref:hypothetical protein n=1 Tax=Endozoicomonas sp. G2_1 TaxID=2821091 RepID=UPI001ADD1675|nr:hypothetical protein [Endozoicomonas sp. G2_1]MBO9492244.1 hypothetical protein [Endozoicomonas sp. G2_1]
MSIFVVYFDARKLLSEDVMRNFIEDCFALFSMLCFVAFVGFIVYSVDKKNELNDLEIEKTKLAIEVLKVELSEK